VAAAMRAAYAFSVSAERAFLDRLRPLVTHPAARGLWDDAAVLAFGSQDLVLTHDMIVEGVHFLPGDDPADVAWKLLAVNLSDLAAKGARPIGVLLGYALAAEMEEDQRFVEGLAEALDAFAVPLLGGDTVAFPAGAPRGQGLTAIGGGTAGGSPSRGGARAGDVLYVTGLIGAAGLGLEMARGARDGNAAWLAAYRRPQPRLAEGLALASLVHAMTDVSDGLLIDARHIAEASGLGVAIDLDAIPLGDGAPHDRTARLAACTAGDDYELLCAAPAGLTLSQGGLAHLSPIGRFTVEPGMTLHDRNGSVPLPLRLGFEHDAP
jgi:thiamine-monophosphate kinase